MSYESQPLDMIAITTSLSNDTMCAYHFALEVGREFTLDEVAAVAERRQVKAHPLDQLGRYGCDKRLKVLALVGVLERQESGAYRVTDAAVEMTVNSLIFGCTDKEIATAPKWLQELVAQAEQREIEREEVGDE